MAHTVTLSFLKTTISTLGLKIKLLNIYTRATSLASLYKIIVNSGAECVTMNDVENNRESSDW
jgi:hypothetical protein